MFNKWIRQACVIAIFLSLAAFASAQNAQKDFFEAFELLKDGKAKEAVAKFETGLKADPSNATARYYLGEAYTAIGQKDKAKEQLNKSLELSPNGPVAQDARKRLGEFSSNAFAKGAVAPSASPTTGLQDCPECPEMVVVPAGQFVMGAPAGEEGRYENEGPAHAVTIAKPFAVGKYEVTFREWEACIAGRGCQQIKDEGWGRDRRPVINVSFEQALGYTEWLSEKTGKKYRLLSEAEWEYAARSGSDKSRFWGSAPDRACLYANVYDLTSKAKNNFNWANFECDDGYANTAPVGSFKPNAFGLYDMLGNVWEWVEDCYNKTYADAPKDGHAWLTGDCSQRMYRGGSWDDYLRFVRSARRERNSPSDRSPNLGFRVAKTLP